MRDWSDVKCCFCGKPLYNGNTFISSEDMKKKYFGNNPYPLSEDEEDRCCDACNMSKVIPARLRNLM